MEQTNQNGGLEQKGEEKTFVQKLLSASSFLRLTGLIIICLGIIGFTNKGYLGTFIFYILVFVLGGFSYFFLAMMLIFGTYLLIKGELPKIRINFTGLGYLLVFIFGALASSYKVEGLSLSSFSEKLNEAMSSISSANLTVASLGDAGKVGGGFIGYFFASLFLTGLGEIGTVIFTYLFLVAGSILILRMPFISVYEGIRTFSSHQLAKKAIRENEEKSKQNPQANKANPSPDSGLNPFKEASYSGPKEAPRPAEAVKEEKKVSTFFGIPRREQKSVPEEGLVSPMEEETSKKEPARLSSPAAPSEPSSPFKTTAAYASPVKEEAPESEKRQVTFSAPAPTPVSPSPAPKAPSYQETSPLKENIPSSMANNTYVEPTKPAAPYSPLKSEPNFSSFKEQETDLNPSQVESEPAMTRTFRAPGLEEKEAKEAAEAAEKAKQDEENGIAAPTSSAPVRYMQPSISLLVKRQDFGKFEQNQQAAEMKIPIINGVFSKLGIGASVDSYTIGPSVTRFNIKREPGVRVSQISNPDVESEIKVDLKGDMSVRIEAVVRGQDTSGVEIGNVAPTMVSFRDCYAAVMKNSTDKLLIPLGEDISSEVITTSLDDLPHLLIAGTTGSGKSVLVHSIIMTLMMRNYPDELKFILVDPKQVEFTRYQDEPHLFCPIITNVVHAVSMLKKLVNEMERRYSILSRYECSKIQEYNRLREKDPSLENLPMLVCVIDEFADMMGQNPRDVDALTQRLAQKARAAGIYLIISTQRPSVKTIPGTIKANIPARIALYLPSVVDSRTILDEGGAEALLGKGDLLARIPALKTMVRLQSPFVSNEEISAVVHYLKDKAKPNYFQSFLNFNSDEDGEEGGTGFGDGDIRRSSGSEDELYDEIKAWVIENNVASTSSLQRHFSIGYGRAASILDALEEEGVIRTVNGNRKEVVRGDNTGTGE